MAAGGWKNHQDSGGRNRQILGKSAEVPCKSLIIFRAVEIGVQYATSDGTGTVGVNYTATSGTLTFEPGDEEKFITISVAASALSDGSQPTFNFTISNPTGRAVLDPGQD